MTGSLRYNNGGAFVIFCCKFQSWQRMEFLYNNNLINEIVDKLFRHRRSDYSEHHLENIIALTDITCQRLPVQNQSYQKLCVSLFTKGERHHTCIVFMHGYGSNRLESTNILKVLTEHYALCAFDFSGSGKSEGDRITYGMKEKEDIHCTLEYLRGMGYKQFVLWGRSMGATASLLYCLKYKPEDVALQIVDSPFFSFEMIAFEIANRTVKAPQFVISFALQLAKKNCSKFQHNPFQIELSGIGECPVPALFVYCEEDNVINFTNTHLICNHYRAIFEKLVIQENHNTVRSQSTITKLFAFVHKYAKKMKNRESRESPQVRRIEEPRTPVKKIRSALLSQKTETQHDNNRSLRKGIQRVQADNEKTERKFDDYGIWVASKFQTQNTHQALHTPHTPNHKVQSTLHKVKASGKVKLLSLSSSFAGKGKTSQLSPNPSYFKGEMSHESSSLNQFTATVTSGREESNRKKITTVKSLGVGRYLNNSKYL